MRAAVIVHSHRLARDRARAACGKMKNSFHILHTDDSIVEYSNFFSSSLFTSKHTIDATGGGRRRKTSQMTHLPTRGLDPPVVWQTQGKSRLFWRAPGLLWRARSLACSPPPICSALLRTLQSRSVRLLVGPKCTRREDCVVGLKITPRHPKRPQQ